MARIAPLLLLVVLNDAGAAEGYQYPPECRGNLVARLEVHVPEPSRATAGAASLAVTVQGGEELEVAEVRLDDPIDAWKAHRASSWSLEDGRVTWSQSIKLRQVKPGFPTIPAVAVRFRAGPAASWEEAMWVNILREPRQPPPPVAAALSDSRQPFWRLVVVGLAGSLIAAAWLRRRRRAVSALSPEDEARRELEAVERAGLAPDELHQRLSDLVRRYLAARWQLPAPRQTTAELLGANGSSVPARVRDSLTDFLHRCDLAKFAPIALTTEQCQATISLARTLLKACAAKQ